MSQKVRSFILFLTIFFFSLSQEVITLCTGVPDYLARPVHVRRLINQSLHRSTNRYVKLFFRHRVLFNPLLNSGEQVAEVNNNNNKKISHTYFENCVILRNVNGTDISAPTKRTFCLVSIIIFAQTISRIAFYLNFVINVYAQTRDTLEKKKCLQHTNYSIIY